MPIASGQRGGPGLVAAPGRGTRMIGAGRTTPSTARRFRGVVLARSESNLIIAGVSRDSVGAILGNCIVDLFRVENNAWIARTTSDGLGNYSFSITVSGPFFIRAYKTGAPDLAGTSLNTLTPVVAP